MAHNMGEIKTSALRDTCVEVVRFGLVAAIHCNRKTSIQAFLTHSTTRSVKFNRPPLGNSVLDPALIRSTP